MVEEIKIKKDKLEGNLKKLKDNYSLFVKKYGFLDFAYMNENFEIENIDIDETELFIKIIRKHMTEKIFYILRTLETFLNPQNAPMFVFDMIKSFSEADKELVREIYNKLGKYEIEAFGLESFYEEKKEAEFVKQVSNEWKDISNDLKKLSIIMKDNYNKDSKKQTKSYFG
jgi:hypothetical protein